MESNNISDYTEADFLAFVKKICAVSDYKTEKEHTDAVLLFEKISEHPDGSDLLYYPKKSQDSSPEGIVKEVKNWRQANGKSGFKK